MNKSEEKYNKITAVIRDYGLASGVKSVCRLCNNVAVYIFIQINIFFMVIQKGQKKEVDRICNGTRPTCKSI